MTTVTDLPLTGVRVLDLTQALAGPFASMVLADLGAEVIKIEPPSGDLTRTTPPYYVGDTSLYFLSNNRNKRGIVLDLKAEPARQAFYDLVRCSDVVFCNFSAGVDERLKIDPDTLEGINPRIITCSVTDFGEHGPKSDRRAVDLIIQSLAGAMSITGEPGRPPARAGVPTGDLSAGLYAVIGIIAALHARGQSGRGRRVETSLFHAQLSLLNYMASYSLFSGESPGPVGSGHPGTVPSQAFQTSDGWITIDAGFDRHFVILCDVIDRPDLAADPRYKDRPSRCDHRATLIPEIARAVLAHPTTHWTDTLDRAGIPCGPVNDVSAALDDTQSAAYHTVRSVSYGDASVQVLATPLWFDDQTQHPVESPPTLGQHTEEVLRQILSYEDARIAAVTGQTKS